MKITLFYKCLIIIAVAFVITSCNSTTPQETLKQAVDFTLSDINGKECRLSKELTEHDFVLVVFGTHWCSSCKDEIPVLKKLQSEHPDNLKIIAIYVGKEQEPVKEIIKKYDINYTVLLDLNAKVSESYRVNATPTMFLIDRKNNILFHGNHVPPEINKYLQVSYHKIEKSDSIMGTNILVIAYGSDQSKTASAVDDVLNELRRLEKLMSTFDANSDVSRINQSAGIAPVEVAPEVTEVIRYSLDMNQLTGGVFDITIGSIEKLYGFKSQNHSAPDMNEIKNRLSKVDSSMVKISDNKVELSEKGVCIDLGGIAKGYALESAMKRIQPYHLQGILIQAGGDMKVLGKAGDRLWNVSIKNPSDTSKDILDFSISNVSISTSGDYERYFEVDNVKYHHIIDPHTGESARGCKSVTVFGSNATETDALSTALFVMGPDNARKWLAEHPKWKAVIIDKDNKLWISEGLRKGPELP